jgi:hypothetical protein
LTTWSPVVDGDDLVIGSFDAPVLASWFGGPNDPGDNGQTASGVDNSEMGVLGCALPMHKTASGGIIPGCVGSPLGPIPWKTEIIVNSIMRGPLGSHVVCEQQAPFLIDVGPDYILNRPIDLCPQTFINLGGNLDVGLIPVFFRIIGGAKYLISPVISGA